MDSQPTAPALRLTKSAASTGPSDPPSPLLCGITILTSACLLFLVQPLSSKLILPWFGGSAAVWTTCLLFYQVVLLLGYLYAHVLTKLSALRQVAIHASLLVVSLLALPILPGPRWIPARASDPALLVLGALAFSSGLPYFLLSSTSPLVQSWFARAHGRLPYRYFALSNAGSLLALTAYPFLIEPSLALHRQAWTWSAAYSVFVLLCSATACQIGLAPPHPVPPSDAQAFVSGEKPSANSAASSAWLWLGLAAGPSALLLAISNHLTQNLAPIPLLWVLPLCLYLASFILCFEGRRWYRRPLFLPLLPLALGGLAISMEDPLRTGHLALVIPVLACSLFVCCMVCHGELAALKPPAAGLTRFYLTLAAGGALGGLFVAGVAPRVFSSNYEFPLSIVFVGCLMIAVVGRGFASMPGWRGWLVALALAAACFLPFTGSTPSFPAWEFLLALLGVAAFLCLPLPWNRLARSTGAVSLTLAACVAALAGFMGRSTWDTAHWALRLDRNFYGSLAVNDHREEDPPFRELVNGVISHGQQFLSLDKRREPTTYYTRTSGVGLALSALQQLSPHLRIGVIGLGAGTLAAYGRRGDDMEFYEINPAVVRIAMTDFTFLSGSPARTKVVPGDARISLSRQPTQSFDLLVLDAFTGDAIPVHLLTREAFALYWRHLRPDGILAVHISNRYLDLALVIARGAADFHKQAMRIEDGSDDATNTSASVYALVMNRPGFFAAPAFRDHVALIQPLNPDPEFPAWTDDYTNLFRILKYW